MSSLWWRCGICLTAIATEGQSRAAEGVHTAMPCCGLQNRNKSPLRRHKKTSRTGFNLSSLWWRCGICLTAIATEGQSRAAEGVHTAMPCCGLQNRNKSPLRRHKKTSRTGFNLSSLWWRCGDLNPGPPDRPRHFLHV